MILKFLSTNINTKYWIKVDPKFLRNLKFSKKHNKRTHTKQPAVAPAVVAKPTGKVAAK